MLRFEPQYLRQTIIDNSDRALMQYCCLCYHQLKKLYPKKPTKQQISILGTQPWFLLRTLSQLSLIFKDKSQSPMLKFKTTKLITYLLLMNQPQIYKKFQLELFPLIKNICHYNKSLRIQERGYDFFKKNKYYEVANVEEREKIKVVGGKFVMFCLEVVCMMNKWMPLDVDNRKELTAFGRAYEELARDGVRFPEEEDFLFFSQQKIAQMIKNVQKCQTMVRDNKFSPHSTKLVKYNALNRSTLSNQNSVSGYSELPSYLQKQLQQKQQAILEYKQNLEEARQEKSFLIKQFDGEKQYFKDKMQEYENQIKRLYFEVKYLRKKLGKYENSEEGENSGDMEDFMLFESSVQSERSDVIDLREKIRLLIQENLSLREQNERLQKSLQEAEGEFFKESRKKIHHLNLNKKQLMEQLLKNDCQENRQFQPKTVKGKQQQLNMIIRKKQAFQTGNFLPTSNQLSLKRAKSEQHLPTPTPAPTPILMFQPFYTTLPLSLRTRLKKCLLKPKQLLYKDSFIQVGIKTTLLDQITLLTQIIITNITTTHQKVNQLRNLKVEVLNKNTDSEVIIWALGHGKQVGKDQKSQKNRGRCEFLVGKLIVGQQCRFQLKLQVNNINFRHGLFMKLAYGKQRLKSKSSKELLIQQQSTPLEQVSLALILPISKIKLAKFLKTSSSQIVLNPKLHKNTLRHPTTKDPNILMKLFYLNHRVLESLQKLQKYFGEELVFISHSQKISASDDDKEQQKQDSMQVSLTVQLLEKVFAVRLGYVKDSRGSSVMIPQSHPSQSNLSNQSQKPPNPTKKLIKLLIYYSQSTSYLLVDYLATQLMFILSDS